MTNTLYSKSHLNHTVNIQSELGFSGVVKETTPQGIMWWQGLHLHETVGPRCELVLCDI